MKMKLNGVISYVGKGFMLFEQGEIGWKVMVPEQAFHPSSMPTTIYVHEVWREQEHELYGFTSIDALELFWQLLSVSGVGPKSAQKIVFQGGVAHVRRCLEEQNIDFFQSISGIGKKTAQKILLELKGVLKEASSDDQDLLTAMQHLGYKSQDVRELIHKTQGSLEERVRQVLALVRR